MFAETVKKLLKDQDRKQSELAEYVGVKPNTVSDWIKKGTSPKLEHLYRIAEFFNVSYDYLFTGSANAAHTDFNKDDLEVLRGFNLLDDRGKTMVKATLYKELDRIEEKFIEPDDGGPIRKRA